MKFYAAQGFTDRQTDEKRMRNEDSQSTPGQKLFLPENCSHPIMGQISKTPCLFIWFETHSYIVWVSHEEIS